MYMIVFPFLTFTAISGRAVVMAGVLTRAAWICVHVAPPLVDFQTPRAYEPAYTMFGFCGSRTTRRTPRGEHVVPLAASAAFPWHSAAVGAPLWMKVHVAPPSVDL